MLQLLLDLGTRKSSRIRGCFEDAKSSRVTSSAYLDDGVKVLEKREREETRLSDDATNVRSLLPLRNSPDSLQSDHST